MPQENAPTDDLINSLNELLQAERAGARVMRESLQGASDPALRALIEAIGHDEVKWCGVLMRAIRHLGGEAGTRTGDFHGKAMAIAGLPERLAFVNRGQGWVAKKLRELLPRVQDAQVHADLQEMLQSHVDNLGKVNGLLGLAPPERG